MFHLRLGKLLLPIIGTTALRLSLQLVQTITPLKNQHDRRITLRPVRKVPGRRKLTNRQDQPLYSIRKPENLSGKVEEKSRSS